MALRPARWTPPGPCPYNRARFALRAHRAGPGAQVAQLVEHVTENHGVGGSIPPLGTTPPPRFISLRRHSSRSLTLFRRHGLAPDITLHQHSLIVDRIAARDGDGAAAALLAHVESSRHRIMTAYLP